MNARKLQIVSAGRFGWFFVALGFGVLTSCGGDDTTPNGSTGAGGTGGSAAGTGGTAGAGGAGGAGGGGTMVNGCASTTAVDKTASTTTTVTFSDLLVYDPPCIRIKVGSSVTWSGNFVAHPLQGGTASTPDPTSPIKFTIGADAGPVTVTFPNAGAFGYYCTIHGAFGMKGAVFVVP